MRSIATRIILVGLLLMAGALPFPAFEGISIRRETYRGWPDSIVMGNGRVEAVIVPAIGRVMQLRFAGETDGPFWENAKLDGRQPDPASSEWGNFGGDKTWPAPQADWPTVTPRAWPPPVAFDSMPVQAEIWKGTVELISPVDPHYGIRTRRLVRLDPRAPKMTIVTTYEKVEGPPRTVAVWTITQLKDPETVQIPLPAKSLFPEGYNKQSKQLPAGLTRAGRTLTLRRDAKASTKIGSDAGALVWVGKGVTLRIDSPRVPGAAYPDQGSSAEVYTNADPLAYVELEMLGPLREVKAGDRIERTNVYTLQRRKP